MELRHLRYFLAVAEGENFRSAATRLHVSQPALSKQIQDLEAELGFDLFRREGRRVRLTEAGLSFAESAGQILEQLKLAIRQGRAVAEGTEGTLTIGFNEIATRHPLVPTAFQRVRLALPNLDLNLAPLVSPDQLRAIETGEVDAGFVYLFDHSRPGLASMEVSLDPWALAVPTGHPLAEAEDIKLADLANERFAFIPRHLYPEFYDALMAACRSGNLFPDVVQHATNDDALLSLVSAGTGLCFVCMPVRPRENVVYKTVSDLPAALRFDLVWHRDNVGPALQRFVGIVRELHEQMGVQPA